ncbi:hypothetical protein [Sphingomonas sp. SAFR-052]
MVSDPAELHSVLTDEEQRDILRDTIIHFLSLDPLHPLASFFGHALSDLD